MKNRDHKSKESLIKYLQKDTDERLWQAIRNWANVPFIYVSYNLETGKGLKDTFYVEADTILVETEEVLNDE